MTALALLLFAAVLVTARQPFSYIYKRGDSAITRISGSFDRIREVSKKYGNEFVWLQMDGRSYVIRDVATLGEVRHAFRHLEELDPSLREVERRLRPFEQEMEKIEDRIDDLSDSLDDRELTEATRDDIEEKLRDFEKKLSAVEAKASVIEREMERLEEESERREKIAEKQFEEIVLRAVKSGVAERQD
jgi:chromosome segregation ATPase